MKNDVLVDEMMPLANLVRASRLAQGLTRDELADATGLSPKFISHVEGGKQTAQFGKVLQLLAELGIVLRAHATVDIPEKAAKQAMNRRGTRRVS